MLEAGLGWRVVVYILSVLPAWGSRLIWTPLRADWWQPCCGVWLWVVAVLGHVSAMVGGSLVRGHRRTMTEMALTGAIGQGDRR